MKTSAITLFATALLAASSALIAAEPATVQWAAQALGAGGAATTRPAEDAPSLIVKRQEHGELGFSKSVVGTPLRIGSTSFANGLGTHSHSEIIVRLPAGGGSQTFFRDGRHR